MDFSFIIPTYNRGSCLRKTLDTLLLQTFQNFEIIVVDDGSTDETSEMLSSLIVKEPRVSYIRQKQGGASKARNVGVLHAKGDYIVYMDSDDLAAPALLETIYKKLNQHPTKRYGIVNHIRHIVLLDQTQNIIDEHAPFIMAETAPTLQEYYHWKVKTTSSGFFHERRFWNQPMWDEELSYLEDWELLLQFGRLDQDGFLFIEDPLVTYTQSYGGDGMCSNADYADWAKAFDYVYKKHKDDPLMVGQTWWPDRVERYGQLQIEVTAGRHLPQVYKYFPNYKPFEI